MTNEQMPTVPPPSDVPLLLYDGVCNMCNGAVRYILARDKPQRFRFAAQQSQYAHDVLAHFGITLGDNLQTVYLVYGGRVYDRSNGALKMGQLLGGVSALTGVCYIFPRFLRDWVYDLLANNRYRLFGRHDTCRMPSAAERARFWDLAYVPPEDRS